MRQHVSSEKSSHLRTKSLLLLGGANIAISYSVRINIPLFLQALQ